MSVVGYCLFELFLIVLMVYVCDNFTLVIDLIFVVWYGLRIGVHYVVLRYGWFLVC